MDKITQFMNKNFDKFKIDPETGLGVSSDGASSWIVTLWNSIQSYISTLSVTVGGLKVNDLSINNSIAIGKSAPWYVYSDNYKWRVYLDDNGIWRTDKVEE